MSNKTSTYTVNKPDGKTDKMLQTFRIFGIICGIILPVFGLVHQAAGDEGDPLIVRFILGGNFLISIGLTFVWKWLRDNIYSLVLVNAYITTAWFLSVIYFGGLKIGYAFGYALIIMVVCLIVKKVSELLSYLVFAVLGVGFVAYIAVDFELKPNLFFAFYAALSIFLFFLFRARIRMQDKLAIKEELLRNIFNESADSLFLVESGSALTIDCNDRAFQKFNPTSKDQLIGITLTDLNKENAAPESISDMRSILAKEEEWYGEIEYQKFNGECFWGSVAVNKVRLLDQHEWLIRITDITDKKKYEQEIQNQNLKITQSINYAQRIQQAILPTSDEMGAILNDHFVLYHPRDIVSGDFYWAQKAPSGKVVFTVGDCTGHGVPGAFMSMIGITLLNEIVKAKGIDNANLILDLMKEGVITSLKQQGSLHEASDGMDMAICVLDRENMVLDFSGACNDVCVVRDGELTEYLGDIDSVTYSSYKDPFKSTKIDLQKGDMIFLHSDGFKDQKGGPNNKKFYHAKILNVFKEIASQPVQGQHDYLEKTFINWKGEGRQVDDVCVMGVRV